MRGSSDHLLLTCLMTLVVITEMTPSDLRHDDLFIKLKTMILNATAEKIEWSNNTCRQSNHYYYKQLVCVNSSPPDILKAFNDSNQREAVISKNTSELEHKKWTFSPQFKTQSDGTEYKEITVNGNGGVKIDVSGMKVVLSRIDVLNGNVDSHLFEILSNVNYTAIRWPEIHIKSNEKLYKAQVTLTMYPNGVIWIYYENIPDLNDIAKWKSPYAVYMWPTGNVHHYGTIHVPKSMIKTGTLVYFKPTEKYCSKSESMEACIDASTREVKCYWCEKIRRCSNGYDMNTDAWNNNKCDNTAMYKDLATLLLSKAKTTPSSSTNPDTITDYISFTNNTSVNENLATFSPSYTETTQSSLTRPDIITTITSQMNSHTTHSGGTRLYLYIFLPISLTIALVGIIFGVMYLKRKLNTTNDEQSETNGW